MIKNLVPILVIISSLNFVVSSNAQNIRPRPTVLDINDADTIRVPTPLRRFDVEIAQVENMRLEVFTRHYAVFSDLTSFETNRRLFVWDGINRVLRDTRESAVPQSLLISKDEKYFIYLVNETQGGNDINSDGTLSTGVLRMYHLETGQRVNLGIPARSATPIPTIQTESQFEYFLQDNTFIFSHSTTEQNNSRETDAPWLIVDMLNIVHAIEGTPTPTPSNTPTFTPTPPPSPTPEGPPTNTPTPSATATATPFPEVPPGFIKPADINSDGFIDGLDLLILKEFWFIQPTPTPRP